MVCFVFSTAAMDGVCGIFAKHGCSAEATFGEPVDRPVHSRVLPAKIVGFVRAPAPLVGVEQVGRFPAPASDDRKRQKDKSQAAATYACIYFWPLLPRFSSANTITDVGVEALAKALVGESPRGGGGGGGGVRDDEEADQGVNAEEGKHPPTHHQDQRDERPGRRTPVLKTLDLGQVGQQADRHEQMNAIYTLFCATSTPAVRFVQRRVVL